ncbi:hypothetical protein K1T71_001559 [Dendrolimus kikuchii]|uniref:Uncharacterized protein n=1 Tax=Dendrolimus kikuchii TaxID=765133 RepID=A0ACC1DE96_9NEOP|nr:hypothetical protein K1T71_001559 [Dendrolimus kikuchii]
MSSRLSAWSGAAEIQTVRASLGGEAMLQDLRAATNYSIWVRARADRGLGPPSNPVYCTTGEDAPDAVEAVRAIAAGADAVRVTWLAPAQRAGRLTHYTLYIRELGKVGGEWSQRVEAADADEEGEAWREVRGLRERTLYELWVRAATAAGAGPPSRPVTAAPAPTMSPRISSIGRVVHAVLGARARLRCAAVGAPPLRWLWSPAPPGHSFTDAGDMIIHKVELQSAGNYTCSVRNGGGSDAAVLVLSVRTPPGAPVLRLNRAEVHALHLSWGPPPDGGASLLGYTIWWSREGVEGGEGVGGEVRSRRVPAGDSVQALGGLACGARYRVTMSAHNAVGESPHSAPLLARTRGDKAKAPPGKEFVWANSTCLRLNLLAWGGRCPVARWRLALRPREGGAWTDLHTEDGEAAQANNLRPGSWYEVRVVARSPAGDTSALYRAATLAPSGERLGEAVEVAAEGVRSAAEGAGVGASAGAWRAGLAPALVAAALGTLLAALAGVVLLRRRRAASCLRRECSLHEECAPPAHAHAHAQLYTTEPGKRNGKALPPPDGDIHEISPYATFSMSERGGGLGEGGGGCALHLRTFGRAEPLDLVCRLLKEKKKFGRPRDSESESSGSPCAACAADPYGPPSSSSRFTDTLPAVESSAEDTSYGAGSRGPRAAAPRRDRGTRQGAKGRRRRDQARHPSGPTVSSSTPASRALRTAYSPPRSSVRRLRRTKETRRHPGPRVPRRPRLLLPGSPTI